MKSRSVIFVSFWILTLSGCTQQSVDIDAERAALLAAADAYHETAHRSEWSRLIESDADDILILPPNAAEISGLEAARKFFAAAPDVEFRYGSVIAAVAASGDMGYTLTGGVVRFDGPDGNPAEDKFRDFHLWKKQDGEWKIAIDMWSSELPCPCFIE